MMSHRFETCVLLIALAWADIVGAAPIASLAPVPGQEFREEVDAPRSVGSSSVVGMLAFATNGQSEAATGSMLFVFLPDGLADVDRLRVEVESPDSRYRGAGLFTGPAEIGSWAQVELLPKGRQTRRPDTLPLAQLAVSAVRLRGGTAVAVEPLVSAWNPSDGTPLTLRLFVNSRRARLGIKGTKAESPCRKIDITSTVAFDHVCDIPASELATDEHGARRRLTVLRRDGISLDPIRVLVPLPPVAVQ